MHLFGVYIMKNTGDIKLSFVGDIMCEKPLLKASKQNGKYNFDPIFKHMRDIFNNSDYVVGNLETVCAGEEVGYTDHIFNFNTPDEFIESIKKSGIDMVTTATNHCLDRGVQGLKRNIKVLEQNQLEYVGTNATKQGSDRVFVKKFHGVKASFLNYTYGTNVHINENILDENELFHVNLLQSQDIEIKRLKERKFPTTLKGKIARTVFKFITLEQWLKFKKTLGLKHNEAYQDNSIEGLNDDYLKRIKKDIKRAKEKADLVIMCMHSGGQFNEQPGKFSEYMMNFMSENGVDVVVGNHPHVVQRHEMFSTGMLGMYSLGNFSISPSSVYLIHENLPEYSIMPHLYLDTKSKRLKKATFTILKIVEDESGSLEVYPIDKLIQRVNSNERKQEIIKNSTTIYNRFLNKNKKEIELKDEYLIRRVSD